MTEVRGLDPGFGDRNTFALTLLGFRRLVEQLEGLVTGADGQGADQVGVTATGERPEPMRFDHVFLGLLAIGALLDEICGHDIGVGAAVGDDGSTPAPEPRAALHGVDREVNGNEVRDFLR